MRPAFHRRRHNGSRCDAIGQCVGSGVTQSAFGDGLIGCCKFSLRTIQQFLAHRHWGAYCPTFCHGSHGNRIRTHGKRLEKGSRIAYSIAKPPLRPATDLSTFRHEPGIAAFICDQLPLTKSSNRSRGHLRIVRQLQNPASADARGRASLSCETGRVTRPA